MSVPLLLLVWRRSYWRKRKKKRSERSVRRRRLVACWLLTAAAIITFLMRRIQHIVCYSSSCPTDETDAWSVAYLLWSFPPTGNALSCTIWKTLRNKKLVMSHDEGKFCPHLNLPVVHPFSSRTDSDACLCITVHVTSLAVCQNKQTNTVCR